MTKQEALRRMEQACEVAHGRLGWCLAAEEKSCAAQADRLANAANAAANVARVWGELAALLPSEAARSLPCQPPQADGE